MGRLGNIAEKPSLELIEDCKKTQEVNVVLNTSDIGEKHTKLHQLAKKHLDNSEIEKALTVLFCI